MNLGSEVLSPALKVAFLPAAMEAVLLTGHGGLEKLEYRTDVPVPRPKQGEALIEVAAAGIGGTSTTPKP